ncbi:MAG: tetratricopeptide repeat protein, partial [Magnetococcales bacterium]|nr:tetratricopeptide repeat protein [Magnetococcales bacterium]
MTQHRMQQAAACFQSDRMAEAERLYRRVLKEQPTHPEANHNLGVVLRQRGRA